MSDRHLGNKEVAEYLNIDRRILKVFRSRNPRLFPAPIAKLACGPIWHKSQLKEIKVKMGKGGFGALRKAIVVDEKIMTGKEHEVERSKLMEKAKKERRPLEFRRQVKK